MAKLDDQERMRRLWINGQSAARLDIHNLLAERKRLCPKCQRPFDNRETRVYFGEKFCLDCIEDMRPKRG